MARMEGTPNGEICWLNEKILPIEQLNEKKRLSIPVFFVFFSNFLPFFSLFFAFFSKFAVNMYRNTHLFRPNIKSKKTTITPL